MPQSLGRNGVGVEPENFIFFVYDSFTKKKKKQKTYKEEGEQKKLREITSGHK